MIYDSYMRDAFSYLSTALLGAHGANVIINWKEMRFGILRAALLGLYVVFDVSWALYQRYGGQPTSVSLIKILSAS